MNSIKTTQLNKLKAHKSQLENYYNELQRKIKFAKERKRLGNKISSTCNKIEDIQLKNERLFCVTHFRENQLKNYYTEIRSRAYTKTMVKDDDIQRIAEENIKFISKIQDYIRLELDQTKKELEYESIEQFKENVKKQDEALYLIIQSEKLIFEKITTSMDKIAKIKDDFDKINYCFQKQIEDNRLLNIKYDIALYENKCIKKMLKEQMKNNDLLVNMSNNTVKEDNYKENLTQSNDTASNIRTTNHTARAKDNRHIIQSIKNQQTQNSCSSHHRSHTECALYAQSPALLSRMRTESSGNDTLHHFDSNSKSNDQIVSISNNNDISTIIMRTRELIKTIQRDQLKRLVRNNKVKAKRNNMKQLMKKCIEDFSYDYSLLCSLHNTQSKGKNDKAKEKCTKELELITYIYDNWFQRNDENNQMLKSQSCRLRLRKK